ncbi:hypothetical protein QJS10_CPA16g00956 [Acorus calamus]|uniref:Uncharacterized protein n=1 Tax=Acorus calamus TaxID=4465 RepID=A0AAV9CZT4_ACOCL|nr:hypothetical protein QJS10_CPA16g00956 [Acorus calamus]
MDTLLNGTSVKNIVFHEIILLFETYLHEVDSKIFRPPLRESRFESFHLQVQKWVGDSGSGPHVRGRHVELVEWDTQKGQARSLK